MIERMAAVGWRVIRFERLGRMTMPGLPPAFESLLIDPGARMAEVWEPRIPADVDMVVPEVHGAGPQRLPAIATKTRRAGSTAEPPGTEQAASSSLGRMVESESRPEVHPARLPAAHRPTTPLVVRRREAAPLGELNRVANQRRFESAATLDCPRPHRPALEEVPMSILPRDAVPPTRVTEPDLREAVRSRHTPPGFSLAEVDSPALRPGRLRETAATPVAAAAPAAPVPLTLAMAADSSALTSLLSANVTIHEPEQPSAPVPTASPIDVDAVMEELASRWELEFLRMYGTSGA